MDDRHNLDGIEFSAWRKYNPPRDDGTVAATTDELTRAEAFARFNAAVIAAVPETLPDWPERRKLLRDAGLNYAHAAAHETLRDMISAVFGGSAA